MNVEAPYFTAQFIPSTLIRFRRIPVHLFSDFWHVTYGVLQMPAGAFRPEELFYMQVLLELVSIKGLETLIGPFFVSTYLNK